MYTITVTKRRLCITYWLYRRVQIQAQLNYQLRRYYYEVTYYWVNYDLYRQQSAAGDCCLLSPSTDLKYTMYVHQILHYSLGGDSKDSASGI